MKDVEIYCIVVMNLYDERSRLSIVWVQNTPVQASFLKLV